MIKRLIILLILVLPFVSADITLDSISKTILNLGDELQISGNILESQDMQGLLKFDLICEETKQLLVKSITLTANTQKTFNERVTMPNDVYGSCNINVYFEYNDDKISESSTSNFELTKELDAAFSLDKDSIQLGEDIEITGTVTKKDGSQVNGIAQLKFKTNDQVVFSDTAQIKNGNVKYIYKTKELPAGNYIIEIKAQDAHNNEANLELGPFSIASAITVSAQSNKLNVLPSDDIKIFGEATTSLGSVPSGKVRIKFLNYSYETKIRFGDYSIYLEMPSTIISGKLKIDVYAEDADGNTGYAATYIIIVPIPTGIELQTDRTNYNPGDLVKLKPLLLDQAGDIVVKEVLIEVYDPENKKVYSQTIESTKDVVFTLATTALPGNWKIKASANKVIQELSITVGEFVALDFRIEDSILHVRNIGNKKFKDQITISLENPEKSSYITKDLVLSINETESINLAKGTAPGTYTVKVADKLFENVEIKGKTSRSWLLYILTLFLILILIFIFKNIKKLRNMKIKKVVDKVKISKQSIKNIKTRLMNKKQRPIKFRVKKSENDYIFELPSKKKSESAYDTSSYSSNYSNYENKSEPSYSEEKKDNEDKKGGLFNMFD